MTIKLAMMVAMYCLFVVGPPVFADAQREDQSRLKAVLAGIMGRLRAAAPRHSAAPLPLPE
jgi:hypothetical protein